ncbi:MAG: YdbL family protein [Pseudomonadota bacterium]
MKSFKPMLFCACLAMTSIAWAQQADLEINSPAVSALKSSMQSRHGVLGPHFASGAVGLTKDGLVTVRDANAIPLSQRQAVNSAVNDENRDRQGLYREIARANNHPEWEGQVRDTFAQRWVQKAQSGWWYQDASGAWKKK